jgi:hypothetical protein
MISEFHEAIIDLQHFPSIWDHSVIPGLLGDPIWTENAEGMLRRNML